MTLLSGNKGSPKPCSWKGGPGWWTCGFMHVMVIGVLIFFSIDGWGQTSTNYQNKEHVVNAGGNPAPTLTSTTYSITLSSIGDGLVLTGMSSPSYQMDGGFIPAYPPPEEVFNLRFISKTTFAWDPERSVGTYQVYRGDLSSLPGSYGSCFASGLTTTQASDTTIPASGQGFFYLVTARNRISEEGILGKDSQGNERANGSPCP